jgi:hypothetical protein
LGKNSVKKAEKQNKMYKRKSRWFYQRVKTGSAREVKLALPESSMRFTWEVKTILPDR